ncbi:acyl-CoA desaturase [Agromyces sp. H3Y2-19a]|jgi:fatty acid desaturase|uniref:fatty acid desaturase family protein n=1 Tax=Agromyces TaxID=33877 RepID=UPI001E5FE77B|nr:MULTISPECIES: acyl-CoA desaturase [Agromyces]MCD5344852.1 acyl-CoA desaturase [Agromyces sp. S2-1-8]MDF0513965.1 acyl-CoA desaturase [Agromyces chromiiresistens]
MDEASATQVKAAAPVARPNPNSDFTDLARLVKSAGLMRRRYGYYWTKLIAVPMAVAAAIAVFIWIGDSWWQMFTAAVFAFLFTQTAFLGHDAAHRQIFRSGKWNDWTSLVLGGIVGMSYGWWQHKHTRHHANPNQLGADPDIELPVVAFTPEQAARERAAFFRWVIAHQGVFFFPILLLEGLSLHASSVHRVLAREHLAHRPVEIAFLAVRIIGYLALVLLVLSPDKAAVFLAIQLGLFGFYMGMSFAPNHKGMPLVPKGMKLDFLRRQALMSRNIRGNRVLDFAMGGLNYQIEHHLFPSMPRPHLRRAAPLIAAYLREHDVPYTQTTLWRSYAIVFHYINRVGLGERDPFECPLVAQRASI